MAEQKGEPMTKDEFTDLVGIEYADEYEKAQLSQEGTTTVAKSKRTFVELLVHYPHPDVCTYPEYKGKPYYSIKYIEDGECFVGFGTYKPEVLSQYLRDYFMPSAQPERKKGKWVKIPGMNEYCTACNQFFPLSYFQGRPFEINYCPHCGAMMEVAQDE